MNLGQQLLNPSLITLNGSRWKFRGGFFFSEVAPTNQLTRKELTASQNVHVTAGITWTQCLSTPLKSHLVYLGPVCVPVSVSCYVAAGTRGAFIPTHIY